MPSRLLPCAVALTALAGAATLAAAQTPPPSPDDQAAAHARQGGAFLDAHAYDKALAELRAAYALAPRPLLLYQMAEAELGLGDKPSALALFQQFVAQDPQNQLADDARAQVTSLTAAIAAEKTAPPKAPQSPPPATVKPAIVVTTTPAEPAHPRAHRHHTLWMIAAGAAAIAAGVALDTLPGSSHDGRLGALDFAPPGLYVAGLGGIALGWMR